VISCKSSFALKYFLVIFITLRTQLDLFTPDLTSFDHYNLVPKITPRMLIVSFGIITSSPILMLQGTTSWLWKTYVSVLFTFILRPDFFQPFSDSSQWSLDVSYEVSCIFPNSWNGCIISKGKQIFQVKLWVNKYFIKYWAKNQSLYGSQQQIIDDRI
jgi:hypothetical protein